MLIIKFTMSILDRLMVSASLCSGFFFLLQLLDLEFLINVKLLELEVSDSRGKNISDRKSFFTFMNGMGLVRCYCCICIMI